MNRSGAPRATSTPRTLRAPPPRRPPAGRRRRRAARRTSSIDRTAGERWLPRVTPQPAVRAAPAADRGPPGPMPNSTSTAEGRPATGVAARNAGLGSRPRWTPRRRPGRRASARAASGPLVRRARPLAGLRDVRQHAGLASPGTLSIGSAALTRTGPSSPAHGPSSRQWGLPRTTGTARAMPQASAAAASAGSGRPACRARSAGVRQV